MQDHGGAPFRVDLVGMKYLVVYCCDSCIPEEGVLQRFVLSQSESSMIRFVCSFHRELKHVHMREVAARLSSGSLFLDKETRKK